MPTRLVREGILSSEAVCSLAWPAEVLYRRLMSVVDDYGRFSASPKLIRAACYPLQIDKVSDADIGKWLAQVAEAGLVSVYPALDGKRYLQIEKFGQQVRAKSKCPVPDDGLQATDNSCSQVPSSVHLGVSVFVSEDVSEETPLTPQRLRSPRGSRLPGDWVLPKAWGEWAMAEQPTWTAAHTRSIAQCFSDYWQSKPGKDATKLDWEKTWHTWVRREGAMKAAPGQHTGTQGSPLISPAIEQTRQALAAQERTPEEIARSAEAAKAIRQRMGNVLKAVA